MSYTKGPWTRTPGERFRHDRSAGVKGPDGNYVAAALDHNRDDRDQEVEDTAQAMSALPDLIAVVRAFVEVQPHDSCECEYVPVWQAALAALAKAEPHGSVLVSSTVMEDSR